MNTQRKLSAAQSKFLAHVTTAGVKGYRCPFVGGREALVVIGVAQQELQRALTVKAKQLGLGKGRAIRSNCDWSARAQGRSAGASVNLSRRVVK